MKNIINKISSVLTAPFRMGYEFVDSRPSVTRVRRHLQRHAPQVVQSESTSGFDVVLLTPEAPEVEGRIICHVPLTNDAEVDRAYAEGIAKGFELTRQEIATLRASHIAGTDRALRHLARKRKTSTPAETTPSTEPVAVMPEVVPAAA
jgi:hypothetical protein